MSHVHALTERLRDGRILVHDAHATGDEARRVKEFRATGAPTNARPTGVHRIEARFPGGDRFAVALVPMPSEGFCPTHPMDMDVPADMSVAGTEAVLGPLMSREAALFAASTHNEQALDQEARPDGQPIQLWAVVVEVGEPLPYASVSTLRFNEGGDGVEVGQSYRPIRVVRVPDAVLV